MVDRTQSRNGKHNEYNGEQNKHSGQNKNNKQGNAKVNLDKINKIEINTDKPDENLDYIIHVKIPRDRIAVFIGTKGKTKSDISEETGCKISIDSDTGIVGVKGTDALKVYEAKGIVNAIARGFSPEKALLLLRTDYNLDIINLKELVRSRNQIKRVKGRIIGEKGKNRAFIEEVSDTYISVYGKTVAIIGTYDKIGLVRKALMMLVNGSPHSRVQTWLEKKIKEFKPSNVLIKEITNKKFDGKNKHRNNENKGMSGKRNELN